MGIKEKLLVKPEEKQEWIDHMERSLADYEAELNELRQRVQGLEWLLHDTRSSAAYRLAHHISRASRWIAPPDTRRRRLLHLAYRGLRAVPKLRHRQWVAQKVEVLVGRVRTKIAHELCSHRAMAEKILGRQVFRQLVFSKPPHFAAVDPVAVSIIIPVFNHCSDSFACLKSISRFTGGPGYEVIVVDDGSTDETAEMLGQVPGLVSLRNDQNLGFIGSCNRGAAVARGEFLVFLNNDTVVTPGWLEALARTFQDIPDAGYVGAKLVYPDGRLQEAGGVIWQDASGWNYGKFDNPDLPRYNYAREVDYCSGACIMVAAALFHKLGGFDPLFAPAYYEDVDLAFKIREAGYKVIYQPLARIIHHEGLTSGTSLESGVKSYQRINQTKFRQRWGRRLEAHVPEPPEGTDRNVYTRSAELDCRDRVLVIDARLIMPDRDCGSLRMMQLIHAVLRRGHHVTFIGNHMDVFSPYLENLQGIGVEVIHPPHYASIPEYLKQHGSEFKLAIISRAEVAALQLTTVRSFAPRARIVFDTVDLHFLREERQAHVQQDETLKSVIADRKKQELRLARRADLTLVVSPVEKLIVEKECPGLDVRVLPTIYPVEERDLPGFADRRGLIFIGGFQHPANVDAVPYFVREVLPRILQRLPDVIFQVVGPDAPDDVLALSSSCVQFLGYVPEVTPLFDRARVSVAPIRFGAGVKGKVNQSMALGVPTVVTSIAAEGMHLLHEHDAMIADDPGAFAEAVVRLYTSEDLWNRLSANGRASVRQHFSVEAASQRVDELLEWAGLGLPSPRRCAKILRVESGHETSTLRGKFLPHGRSVKLSPGPQLPTTRIHGSG